MSDKPEHKRINEDVETKQRGIVGSDMLRQSRSIDEFLWRGDRKAKPIQRAALCIYSIMFLSMRVKFLMLAWK